MAQVRKYANLPDLDNAPDIYETPDLTDDASTLQTATTARSASPDESDSEDVTGLSGVNRRRLHPDQARSHFLPSRVDAREADFSDRLSNKKQSYKVSSRRRRRDGAVLENEEEDVDDWSGDDEEEGLERRLARLQREVEEVKAEVAKRNAEESESATAGAKDEDKTSSIESLSKALDAVRNSQREAVSAHAQLAKQLAKLAPAQSSTRSRELESQAPLRTDPDTPTLARVAAFETRLASLERSLGLGALTTTSNPPILPTLALLDTQVALLTSSDSLPHVETLTQKLQAAASASQNSATTNGPSDTDAQQTLLTPEDKAKLQSLYALLPALSSLSPTLPPLLSRLRSLRTLHAGAATASQTLDDVEKRQEETEKEIAAWRVGLQRVEAAVAGAENGIKQNAGVVEAWVKELEEKVKKLSN